MGMGGSAPAPNPKRDKIETKLNDIILPEVESDNLPLGEVLKRLREEAAQRDPDKKGLNFILSYSPAVPMPTAIDPTTGLPIGAPQETIDPASVSVRFNLPLRNVSLRETLEAIVKVADRPIQFSVEDFGVLVALRSEPVAGQAVADIYRPGPAPQPLLARTFKVDTNTFLPGLQSAFGIRVPADTADDPAVRARDHVRNIQNGLKEVLQQLGVSSVDAKTIFYNDLTGIVMVRARPEDLETINAAMETLGGTQVGSAGAFGGGGGYRAFGGGGGGVGMGGAPPAPGTGASKKF
jgi:hypothetical protein